MVQLVAGRAAPPQHAAARKLLGARSCALIHHPGGPRPLHRRAHRHARTAPRALWGPKPSEDEFETEYETVYETDTEAAAAPSSQRKAGQRDAAPASSRPGEEAARAASATGAIETIRAQILMPLQPVLPYLAAARPLVAHVSFSSWALALALLLAVRQGRVRADEDRLDYRVLQVGRPAGTARARAWAAAALQGPRLPGGPAAWASLPGRWRRLNVPPARPPAPQLRQQESRVQSKELRERRQQYLEQARLRREAEAAARLSEAAARAEREEAELQVRLQAAGCGRRAAVGCRLQAAGCRLQAAGGGRQAASCCCTGPSAWPACACCPSNPLLPRAQPAHAAAGVPAQERLAREREERAQETARVLEAQRKAREVRGGGGGGGGERQARPAAGAGASRAQPASGPPHTLDLRACAASRGPGARLAWQPSALRPHPRSAPPVPPHHHHHPPAGLRGQPVGSGAAAQGAH
jgi:hypothetical protein